MGQLLLKEANLDDVHMLTERNQELIREENSENPMTYSQLYNRMSGFLDNDWRAVFLIINDEIAGYALFRERENGFDPNQKEIYLRQYLIRKNYRGRGWGREGIHLLMSNIFSPNATIHIDVLESNPGGRKFWESMGFKPYYINMRLTP
ncbi:hypothetical protein AMS62_20720 [Bacillus sp. FJAT-18019]|nr:hypothetical protein AMS62_20720 [Bacillus sp. FJAT-18019]